jgi:hypothetical protein
MCVCVCVCAFRIICEDSLCATLLKVSAAAVAHAAQAVRLVQVLMGTNNEDVFRELERLGTLNLGLVSEPVCMRFGFFSYLFSLSTDNRDYRHT